MTIAEIRTALNNKLDEVAGTTNEHTTLTETANVALTDELAEILETVNPNHDYPPTNK